MYKTLFWVISSFLLLIPFANAEVLSQNHYRSIVLIEASSEMSEYMSIGSGTVISDDQYILTNAHVVIDEYTYEPYETIVARFTTNLQSIPNCEQLLRVISFDVDYDFALLQALSNEGNTCGDEFIQLTSYGENTQESLPNIG